MDNRERILQCALELFYAKGYDAVGVQEIAQKASNLPSKRNENPRSESSK